MLSGCICRLVLSLFWERVELGHAFAKSLCGIGVEIVGNARSKIELREVAV